MTNIVSYLTFNGDCREAMNFYKECIGGDLYLQTVGESPMADKMPPQMKESVMHSSLSNGDVAIMASDMCGPGGLIKGNSVSLCINCTSDEEIEKLFKKLAEGGTVGHPLEDTFWGARFGDLTDKFGIHWLLNYSK